LWNHQGWDLTWNDPVVVNFGNGGQFQIELEDVGYESYFWIGPDGTSRRLGNAKVDAWVTHLSDPEPVPEPATVAILGIGIVGLAGAEVRRRRKKRAVDKS
jgi:hypothetical protein